MKNIFWPTKIFVGRRINFGRKTILAHINIFGRKNPFFIKIIIFGRNNLWPKKSLAENLWPKTPFPENTFGRKWTSSLIVTIL